MSARQSASAANSAIKLMERHPIGSQAFIPMQERPWLVLVCDDPLDVSTYHLFSATGRQGELRAQYAIIPAGLRHGQPFPDRGPQGPVGNLEEVWLPEGCASRRLQISREAVSLAAMTKTPTYFAPHGNLPPQTELLTSRAIFTTAYAFIPKGVMRDIVTGFLPGWDKTRARIIARPMTGFAGDLFTIHHGSGPWWGQQSSGTGPAGRRCSLHGRGIIRADAERQGPHHEAGLLRLHSAWCHMGGAQRGC